jgi:hypothetical protein
MNFIHLLFAHSGCLMKPITVGSDNKYHTILSDMFDDSIKIMMIGWSSPGQVGPWLAAEFAISNMPKPHRVWLQNRTFGARRKRQTNHRPLGIHVFASTCCTLPESRETLATV